MFKQLIILLKLLSCIKLTKLPIKQPNCVFPPCNILIQMLIEHKIDNIVNLFYFIK